MAHAKKRAEIGLRNPCCGSNKSKVLKSTKGHKVNERYRECLHCGGRFVTIELVARLTSRGDI